MWFDTEAASIVSRIPCSKLTVVPVDPSTGTQLTPALVARLRPVRLRHAPVGRAPQVRVRIVDSARLSARSGMARPRIEEAHLREHLSGIGVKEVSVRLRRYAARRALAGVEPMTPRSFLASLAAVVVLAMVLILAIIF